MTISNMPTIKLPNKARFLLRANTQTFESPLNRTTQTLELSGARWEATYELSLINKDVASEWIAWLSAQLGRSGRFYAGDPGGKTPRGVATGTPLIDGGSQTGKTLATKGWTPSITNILKIGDYIAFDTPTSWRELHIVTANANSDSFGKATLNISPPIRESPANNATIITNDTTCVMRLDTDEGSAWDISAPLVYTISFNAVETFK